MTDDLYIGLGANLPHPEFGSPRQTLERALAMLSARGIGIKAVSPFYESAPVPASAQPWYVNAVARAASSLSPEAVLAVLHEVEMDLGRQRGQPNAARMIDLDLLSFGGQIRRSGPGPHLPHPRMHERAFVLIPLRDLAPDWRHPESGKDINRLIAALPAGQEVRRI